MQMTEDHTVGSRETDLKLDAVALTETKFRRDGTIPVKIIEPGWGSCGYYSADALKSSASLFEGAQMFWDHPTPGAMKELPERSLDRLAGVLSSVTFQEKGVDGPGLYGFAKPFSPYKERLPEMAPHIGLSILASGRLTEGEAEGRKGPIIEAITSAKSVDFVTVAGAGGKVVSLFESLRGGVDTNPKEEKKVEDSGLKEALSQAQVELKEIRDENARLSAENAEHRAEAARYREADIIREARDVATETVRGAGVPDLTKARIVESMAKNPPVKDDKLDKEALVASIEEAIKSEAEYLAKVVGAGRVTGLGKAEPIADEADARKIQESLGAAFRGLGLSESQAKAAAQGR